MKKSLKIILIVMIILAITWLVIFAIDYNRCSNLKMPIFVVAEETVDDGGSGTYYGLGYRVEVEKYLSAEYGVQLESVEMYFFNKCIAGAIAEIEKEEDNEVDSSNYKENFKLTYNQRKDLGLKTIIDKNVSSEYDFSVHTFGGDVDIIIEVDMVYHLEDALEQKVITVEDILEQAKQDEKNGICEAEYYKDGGSVEYCYSDYTILKYNTLDGNKDLIIGMQGSIISQVNRMIRE